MGGIETEGSREERRSQPMTRQRGNSKEFGWPELAVKALECQAKDLGLDFVVSSRELLKVLEQRMGFEEDVPDTRWRDSVEARGRELTGRRSQLNR